MYEYPDYEYDNSVENTHPDTQDEIADIFENMSEDNADYMKKQHIRILRNVAKMYYGIDEIKKMESHAEMWNSEYVYILITYEDEGGCEDALIHVGTGEFTEEMFIPWEIPEYRWLSHSPLKLFVTKEWARKQDKESRPKDFLDRNATMYAPKPGKVELRNIHIHQAIDYGDGSNIMKYEDALLALQNAEIVKAFWQKHLQKFHDKVIKLQKMKYEEVKKHMNFNEGFHYLGEEDKEFNEKFFTCLLSLGDGNSKNTYKLIASFDGSSKKFIKQTHKKHQ